MTKIMLEKCWIVEVNIPGYMGDDYWFQITKLYKRAKHARYWYKWLTKRYSHHNHRITRVWRKCQ